MFQSLIFKHIIISISEIGTCSILRNTKIEKTMWDDIDDEVFDDMVDTDWGDYYGDLD